MINEKIFTKGDQWDNSLEFHRVGDALPTSPGEWQSQNHHHHYQFPCVTWNLTKTYAKAHHGQSLQCSANNQLTSRENSKQDSTTLEVFCELFLIINIITKNRALPPSKFSVSSTILEFLFEFLEILSPLFFSHHFFSVAPTVSLHIGKALNLNDLEEGDDVYFECSIQVIFGGFF